MPSRSKMTDKAKCIYCGSINTRKIEDILSQINNKQYQLHHCRCCGIQFILPNRFEDVYTDGVVNQSMNDYVEQLHNGRQTLEPPTLEVIKRLQKLKINLQNKKILDIGAGDGINYLGLNQYYRVEPQNYYVVEGDRRSCEVCRKRGINHVYQNYFSGEFARKFPEFFDVVILTEVLEHQTKPADFIEAVKQITKPRGLIILTVPNRKMLKVSRSVFYADIPPHHFLRFSKDFFLKNLHEFEKVVVSEYPNPFMILNRDRACRKVSSLLFGTEKLSSLIAPFFDVIYNLWGLLLHIRGNGIIVILRKGFSPLDEDE